MAERYKLICASGYQRSGTTVLFNSLAARNRHCSFNESPDNEAFTNKNLLPQNILMPLATKCGGKLIVKPNKLFSMFTLDEIAQRYSNFDMRIVWSFRNPVDVYSSHFQMARRTKIQDHGESEFDAKLVNAWKARNSAVLNGIRRRVVPILIVQYEELIASNERNEKISRFCGVEYMPRHKMKHNHGLGQYLSDTVRRKVTEETRGIYEELIEAEGHQWDEVSA